LPILHIESQVALDGEIVLYHEVSVEIVAMQDVGTSHPVITATSWHGEKFTT
jgi:hypothetical protein